MKIFIEEQRFTQTWLMVILAVSLIVPIGIITQQYLKENTEMTTNTYILTMMGIVISVGLIFFFKLTTRIDEKGIHYKFFPFHLKFRSIHWKDINTASVRNYDPIGEYGGWGLKGGAFWNSGKGKCINVSGDVGIQLELTNGKKLLIGTQKKFDAKKVLETYTNKNNTNE